MAETVFTKAPVLGDLVKFNQPDLVGREKALVAGGAAGLKAGAVLQGTPAAAVQWDLSDPEDIYGILLNDVPAAATAHPSAVLFAGPALVNPGLLVWKAGADADDVKAGLARLKTQNFIFERRQATDALYPEQLDRVTT
jgi:hypothetical protein